MKSLFVCFALLSIGIIACRKSEDVNEPGSSNITKDPIIYSISANSLEGKDTFVVSGANFNNNYTYLEGGTDYSDLCGRSPHPFFQLEVVRQKSSDTKLTVLAPEISGKFFLRVKNSQNSFSVSPTPIDVSSKPIRVSNVYPNPIYWNGVDPVEIGLDFDNTLKFTQCYPNFTIWAGNSWTRSKLTILSFDSKSLKFKAPSFPTINAVNSGFLYNTFICPGETYNLFFYNSDNVLIGSISNVFRVIPEPNKMILSRVEPMQLFKSPDSTWNSTNFFSINLYGNNLTNTNSVTTARLNRIGSTIHHTLNVTFSISTLRAQIPRGIIGGTYELRVCRGDSLSNPVILEIF